MKPRAEWWPQDPDGPLPPFWFYFVKGSSWVWLVIIPGEFAGLGLMWLLDAPTWAWRWFAIAIWFGVGIQVRGLWQQQVDHRAKMRAMVETHERHMAVWDRRMDLLIEAAEMGYSDEWLKMRGFPGRP